MTGHALNDTEASCPGDKEWKQMELRNDPLYEVFEVKTFPKVHKHKYINFYHYLHCI